MPVEFKPVPPEVVESADPKVKAPKIFALLATLNPIPIFTFPEIPTPPVTLSAPVVDEVVLVLDNIDTAPTNVEVD